MLPLPLLLANATTRVLLGVGGLIVVTIIGGLLVLRVRRAMLDDAPTDTQGLLLSDLRAMRARGEISEEEFERLRVATLAGFGYGKDSEESGMSVKQQDMPTDPGGATGE